MSSVAPSPPEQGQLVNVRPRQWIAADVRPSTLPPPSVTPTFHSPQQLLTLSSVEDDGVGEELQVIWEIEPGAKVIEKVALPEPTGLDPPRRLDASLGARFQFGIDIQADSPCLFAFEEPPPELRAGRAVANDGTQAEGFVIPQNMRVPASSVIHSLFDADNEWDAASREGLGDWSDSKGKRLEGRAVAVEARKVADRVSPSCSRSSRCAPSRSARR
jgi:hypothetical protein